MGIFVNATEITEAELAAEVQHHPAPSIAEAEREASRALVLRTLLRQEAERLGLEPAPRDLGDGKRECDEEALIRQLLAREVAVPVADEASCRRYYDNNRNRFRTPDLYEAAHILFPAHHRDREAYASAKRDAAAALARLADDPDAFASLAAELSACSSARDGGSLGQFSRGQTLPEFETFLDNLEPGQTSPVPVPSRYGFHIVRLDRREAGHPLPFEAVQDRIAAYLAERAWNSGVAQYLRILVGQARIEGFEIEGAGSPLVQ